MSKRSKFYKPAIGKNYRDHYNCGGEFHFVGGKPKDPKTYTVTMTPQGFKCNCPGFTYRGKCKHVIAIGDAINLVVS